MPALDPNDVADAIAAHLAAEVEDLVGASGTEPKVLPDVPWASLMHSGFARRGLETNEVRPPIVDPLGGRRWVWEYTLRVWVSLKVDEAEAQRQLGKITKAVIVALEENPTMGIGLDDLAVASGQALIANDQSGPALMLMDMSCAVEWTESANN